MLVCGSLVSKGLVETRRLSAHVITSFSRQNILLVSLCIARLLPHYLTMGIFDYWYRLWTFSGSSVPLLSDASRFRNIEIDFFTWNQQLWTYSRLFNAFTGWSTFTNVHALWLKLQPRTWFFTGLHSRALTLLFTFNIIQYLHGLKYIHECECSVVEVTITNVILHGFTSESSDFVVYFLHHYQFIISIIGSLYRHTLYCLIKTP